MPRAEKTRVECDIFPILKELTNQHRDRMKGKLLKYNLL